MSLGMILRQNRHRTIPYHRINWHRTSTRYSIQWRSLHWTTTLMNNAVISVLTYPDWNCYHTSKAVIGSRLIHG